MRTERRLRPRRRLAQLVLLCAAGVLASSVVASGPAAAQEATDGEVPFAPVFEGVLAGDLVMAGNSNLLAAGAVYLVER